MKKLVPVLALLAIGAFSASAQAVPHSSAQGLSNRDSCGVAAEGSARCFAKPVTRGDGTTFDASPAAGTGTPAGWGAPDLRSAYNLTTDSTATVAIVDAYDNPNAESDLAVYRQQYGLDPCTTSNGCFKKINQNGGTSPLPVADKGWAEEIALDLDMVSAACPHCHILLVEANTNSFANLMAAVDRAASTAGVVAISNSYGGNEFSAETTSTYDSHYNHPGQAVTVSSGDAGYGVEFPASSKYVTAVGGTSLSQATGTTRGWSETAWSGAGSGCSAYEAKPLWQTDTGCSRRTVADVSAVANPNTGVAVNSTYGGDPGWMVFGGTSASSPLIASVYAMGGGTSPSPPYTQGTLFDVTSGSNGRCVGGRRGSTSAAYLCTAGTGYDGPTGLGTPNGVSAF